MAGSLTERMLGAAWLEPAAYEEVEADRTATGQAATVVVLVAIASGIGSMGGGGTGVVWGVLSSLVGWAVGAAVIYLVGTMLLGGRADWGEVARTTGFAQAPGVLYVLGIIPLFGGLIGFGVSVWILVATIIAIRQALDFGTGKAVITAVIGWLVMIIPRIFAGILVALFS